METNNGAEMFTADVWNAVCDYCADGMDAFESCLAHAPSLEPEVIEAIKRGNTSLFKDLLTQVESNLALFENICQTTIFSVPMNAMLPTEALVQPPMPTTSESEAEVDQKLEAARAELAKVQEECKCLSSEIGQLDADMAQHGDVTAFQALSTAATANKAAVMDDVAAIAQAAQQLQPLLARAMRLRSAREPLAARNSGGNGVSAAELRSSQLAKNAGSVESLQQLNSWLKAA